MVNGPPGTSTSAGSVAASAGAGPGSGAVSAGAPARSWWVASIVSSCCASCWAIIPNAKPCRTSRRELASGSPVPSNVVPSRRSMTRPRTSWP